MIVYDLKCGAGHVFEGWFDGVEDFEAQQAGDLLACPLCDHDEISRVPSALAIGSGRSETRSEKPGPEAAAPSSSHKEVQHGQADEEALVDATAVKAALAAIAKAQKEAVSKSDYVGNRFAEEARSMHYGEQDHRPIYGETNREEARELQEEGVPAMPLLFPVRPQGNH